MAASFISSTRTVLLVGDEALCVYRVGRNAASLVDSVPWQAEDFDGEVVSLIRKECGGKPVLIVNDMTDQHFKGGQRLPKVGMMDRANVMRRKLQVAFPNYPIRGALPLKASKALVKKSGGRLSGGLYLFAAVPRSEQVAKTLDAVKASMVSIAGFVLLPVEASDMVGSMSEKLSGRGRGGSRWVVFMGQHQSGALRQVITRDGQLAMTRMTPIVDPVADPQGWARDVSQEFKATISYLSRFGYSSDEGTDVIVIAGQKTGEMLEKMIDIPCNYNALTTPEAARLLGMNVGIQEDLAGADVLHAAWIGRKAKFILPMDAQELSRIYKPRQAAAAAMVLLLLSGGYLGWQMAANTQSMVSDRMDLGEKQKVLAQAEAAYQREVENMAGQGIDVKSIKAALESWDSFELDRPPVLYLVKKIGDALGSDLRLDLLTVDQADAPPPAKNGVADDKKKAAMEAKLKLSFPPTVEVEEGMRQILDLEKRLKGALPDYDVKVTQQIGRPDYRESLKDVAGKKAQEAEAEDYTAELVVWGPKS